MLLALWIEALSRITVSGLSTCCLIQFRNPTNTSAVVFSQYLALSTLPLDSKAASTFKRLPRLASIRWHLPRCVQALRLGCTTEKPASSR